METLTERVVEEAKREEEGETDLCRSVGVGNRCGLCLRKEDGWERIDADSVFDGSGCRK